MIKEEIRSILQKKFPGEIIQFVGEGWTSTAFCIDDKIIRVPKINADKYKKEANILNFVHDKLTVSVPLPQVIEGDLTYALHTKIEGLSWNIETYNALEKSAQDDFCRDIATFFAELHNIPLSEITAIIPMSDIRMHQLLDRDTIRSYLKDEFSVVEIDKLYDFTRDVNVPQSGLVLLHKDFYNNNSLINKNHRLTGVFDFANAGLGERAMDFRPLYNYQYIPLLENILHFYHEITGILIALERVRDLEQGDCLFCIQYLGMNPHLKKTMPAEWIKQVSHARDILKEIS